MGDRQAEANTRKAIGDVQSQRGEPNEALESYQAAYAIYEEIGERSGLANTRFSLGRLLLTSNVEDGEKMLGSAVELYLEIGDRSGEANVGILLAGVAEAKGDLKGAIEALQPAADFCKSIGHPLGDEHQAMIDDWRQRLTSDGG